MTAAELAARTPLLATKLHAPRRRREVVRRTRLTDRMTLEHQPALTLISAPAGFGKTTLLTETFGHNADMERCAAWLALDAADNDPAIFGAYLVAALRSAAPDVGGAAESLLQAAQSLHTVTASVINDLEWLDAEVALVLDDYHVIDSADIHDAVCFLVEHAPPHFHLVIATRVDPPLPLARWRARRDLLEFRAADLRFTADEAESYFTDSMHLQLSAAEVGALEERTEGWIAALQLAALSLRDRDDVGAFIDNFAGDDRFVVDYLVEEVLDRQPDTVKSFLLRTSVLDRLTGELCDAVTLGTDGRATLEQLDRSNLFLVALDDRRHWYRYHHLFADVLQARLIDEDPDLIDELHQRASNWYSATGEPAKAIEHAMAGHHADEAARLIELAAPAMRQDRQEGTLRRWLEALPDELFANRPVLAMGLVGARMATGNTTGVEALLQLVEESLHRTDLSPIVFDTDMFEHLPVQLLIQRAGLALLSGDLNSASAHAIQALELVQPDDHLRRGSASALMAIAHWAAGDLDSAVSRYQQAIMELTSAGHLADMLGCSLALADIQIAQGKLTDANRTFDSGLRWTTEHPGLRGAADMHVGLSEVLIERNDLDAAAHHLETSNELGESAGLPQHAYRWRVTMARLQRARGDLEGALELIDEAAPLYNTDFSPPVRPVGAIRARVRLANGDLDAAQHWVAERKRFADDELSYVHEYEHITLGRILIAHHAVSRDSNSLEAATRLLERLLAAAEHGGRAGTVIEVLILLATAYEARGDTAAAIAALDDALRRAEPDGHIRLFLHAGPSVTSLLRSVSSRDHATAHALRVLAAIDTTAATTTSDRSDGARPVLATRRGLVDELSSRELDVLRLLRSDLSGPEIARELHVSMNTLRTHTKNIYTKLGATSRREATRRAAEHGL
ncbi:MAG: LuxR C-terminal-related transcriptional regulator [Ilumatobacteraceae bacterium]